MGSIPQMRGAEPRTTNALAELLSSPPKLAILRLVL